jgi:hypothetical protein
LSEITTNSKLNIFEHATAYQFKRILAVGALSCIAAASAPTIAVAQTRTAPTVRIEDASPRFTQHNNALLSNFSFTQSVGGAKRKHKLGKGHWVASELDGYYIGRIFRKDNFSLMKDGDYQGLGAYGEILPENSNQPRMCGWLIERALRYIGHGGQYPRNTGCDPYLKQLKDPSTFTKGLNGRPSEYVDGAPTKLTAKCNREAWYNFAARRKGFNNLSFPRGVTGLYDRAGKLKKKGTYYYRYTTPDGKAAVIRDPYKYGWIFVDKKCINGYPQGGTPKRENLKLVAIKYSNDQQKAQSLHSGGVLSRPRRPNQNDPNQRPGRRRDHVIQAGTSRLRTAA